MTTQVFTCIHCRKQSNVATFRSYREDLCLYHVDCQHCGAIHEAQKELTQDGDPVQFRIIGIFRKPR